MIPTSIDGTDITGATIDGTDVQEITVDGQTVFNAVPAVPFPTDLVAHYDAGDLGLSNNNTVNSFDDISGNGHDLTPGIAPTYKTNRINGLPVVEFSLAEFLDVSFSSVSTPFSIFMVFEVISLDVSGSNLPYFHDADTKDNAGFGAVGERTPAIGAPRDAFRMTNNGEVGAGTVPIGSPIMASNVWDGSGSVLRIDGTTINTGGLGNLPLDGFTLAQAGSQQSIFESNIAVAEVLIYSNDKSGNFGTVENYLNAKYDVF